MEYWATVTQPVVTVDGERVELVAGEPVAGLSEAGAAWLLAAGWIVAPEEPKRGKRATPETPEGKRDRDEKRG